MVKTPNLVLVTGATGAVGPRVVAALHEAGYNIRTFSIDLPQAGDFPENVDVWIGDITKYHEVEAAMAGVDFVIHLAALLHIINPPPNAENRYREINVSGTKIVSGIASQKSVKRIVYFSTIAVYGKTDRRILDETAPTNPSTFYERTKLEAEQLILSARNSDGEPIGVVLRLAAVYGSRVKGNYLKLFNALKKKCFIPMGNGLNRRTLVYDKDVARAALAAIENSKSAGKVFNVSDGQFHTVNEIIEAICVALGRKKPRISLPVSLAAIAAGLTEALARVFHFNPPFVRASVEKYMEDIAVESRRIQTELGFIPKYNLASGWADTVQEMNKASKS